ncbi:uncharacterized protein LAJ45_07926 [Morchella importuna]|uniref:uncharacterized protein n=1 Tax=Morchella importuna TaxID=1174673 RepID=UPI001E8D4E5F|nr:uncharacterized protein LAJ45_07926 [Morchella importuna]KAH8148162.1 hypothetical protein LAJ45_07926 [Morchella importuna]
MAILTENYILWSWAIFLMVISTGMSSPPPSPVRSAQQYSVQSQPNSSSASPSASPPASPIGLYITRSRWLPFLSNIIPENAYHRLSSSFEGDIEAGLSSDAFSLAGNVQDGDSRAGLDVASKKEILKIMRSQKVGFDEARQLYMVQKLAKNGIAPDGRPMDPRAVFFS